ncbi:SDR family NAD(P)-dependent oxidoreductase [Rhodoglobus vestalii]|uniref:SDR family NAD(P)-dependent oxidoreductase n=1 Tax=Rhodoglobus vestalii TaxID=193384 RepID=UPI003CCC8CCE
MQDYASSKGAYPYANSKTGVIMCSRTLAAELPRDDVRVHAVCPTAIDSPMVLRAAMGAGNGPRCSMGVGR